MKCPRCNEDLVVGKTLFPCECSDSLRLKPPDSISNYVEIVNCLKCPKCGHSRFSYDQYKDLKEKVNVKKITNLSAVFSDSTKFMFWIYK